MPSYFASRNYCASTGRAMMSATNIAPLNRAPADGDDLIAWTDAFFLACGLDETPEEKRLRHAACLLSDVGWCASRLSRAEARRSPSSIAISARRGVSASPLRSLLTMRQIIIRARVLGAAMCIAYYLSASTPGVLWHWCLVVN